MKNFTVRAEKYFGMGIFSLFVLILSIFTACKQPTWNDPVREYLEYYTETAAVEDFEVVQSYLVDKDGNVCISSFGEETKEILTNYLARQDRNINKLYRYAEKLSCLKILKTYLEVLV